MNRARHQLLASSSLACDQYGRVGGADTIDSLQGLCEAGGVPNDAVWHLPSARQSMRVRHGPWHRRKISVVARGLHSIPNRYLIDRCGASSSVLLSNGFFRNAIAPARSAFARVTASSCAETNTIGIGRELVMSRCCSSRPFMPGNFRSRIAHAVRSRLPRSRNSSAEPNASTVKPAEPTSRSIDRRDSSSSSTIATNGRSVGPMRVTIALADGCVYRTLGLMESRPLGQGRGELLSHPDEIGQRRGLHLPHDLAAMDLDGFLGRAKLAGDLLVQKALDDEREDLTFAWRQGLIALPQPKELLLVLPSAVATRDTLRDCVEQLLIVERLGEELERASLHRSDRHRDVTAPGNEHNRQLKTQHSQFCLQLQPAEIRQVNIKHQTVGILQSIGIQTFRRGAERLHL